MWLELCTFSEDCEHLVGVFIFSAFLLLLIAVTRPPGWNITSKVPRSVVDWLTVGRRSSGETFTPLSTCRLLWPGLSAGTKLTFVYWARAGTAQSAQWFMTSQNQILASLRGYSGPITQRTLGRRLPCQQEMTTMRGSFRWNKAHQIPEPNWSWILSRQGNKVITTKQSCPQCSINRSIV